MMKVALICCGRLENRYAIDFVEYYKQLGIDHIYIADNNREGEEYFEDVLQSYINENFVTIYDYRNRNAIQLECYKTIYDQISNDYNWVLFFDFDEYLTLTEDKNIKEYLSRECFNNAKQILINWKIYTDNDLVTDDGKPCLERFTVPYEDNGFYHGNNKVKYILKGNLQNVNFYSTHIIRNEEILNCTVNNEGELMKINLLSERFDINHNLAYLKHFITKTIDEYINNKWVRGVGDRFKQDFDCFYNLDLFFKYNNITEEKLNYLKEHNIDVKKFEL